ncbi:HAMP domain-containing sensor histidine kinase [Sphaerotilus sp.]|uniref:HAMP domain-containing sensor histidine kinase n=1 Tax=Sphaerotilus sp. TaxID=2093942 RepID=UPI00286DD289|nr:HAMP domain-containing sensor histidine kinase [Sphaerotilus sp.]
MMRSTPTPVSIRRRMLAALLWTSVVWGVVAPLMVVLTIRHEINELLDDTLRASAEALSGIVQAPLPAAPAARRHPPGGLVINPTAGYVRGRFAWQLVGPDREVLLHSPLAPPEPFVPQVRTGLSDAASGWRVLGVEVGGQGQILYVAHSLDERSEALRDAAVSTMLASLVVWAVCVIGLLRRMRSELAQIDRLVADVQDHDPMDATNPLPPVTREELRPIRDAIDDLGARLAVRVRNERAFAAHAAHALRTPLAGMDAQLAVALRECAPEQQLRLQRVRDAAGRFARVVSALLTLFRSGAELHRQPVDVAAMLARMPIAGLDVQVSDAGPSRRLNADPDLLAAALANLFDNALRHGARRVTVKVGSACVRLSDDGPGLEADRLQALQSALDREDHAAFPGLGLVLADLVARAHGGRLRLSRGVQGGLGAELTLAVTAQPE